MIIIRSPFRISYFGGGTDFPKWFENYSHGKVICTSIDKYCYVMLRALPPFFDFNYRLRYFNTEFTKTINQIKHPVIKNVLNKYHKDKNGLEIIHFADVPALSGLGASSAFVASLIKAVNCLNLKQISKKKLAEQSVYIERKLIKENGGYQDQYATSYGGFNEIIFNKEKIRVKSITNLSKIKIIEDNTVIFFTGLSRKALIIENEKIKLLTKNYNYLKEMRDICEEAAKLIKSKNTYNFLDELIKLMNNNWILKKKLSSKVSNELIDNIYNFGLKNGASAGKILGAGAGGFILFLTKNKNEKAKLIKSLSKLKHVNFKFENEGTKIVSKF